MNENIELIKCIYKNADMAMSALEDALKYLKEKDNKIKDAIHDLSEEYKSFKQKAKDMLSEEDLTENNPMGKMMSKMGIRKEIESDNSDASVADMLIQGISMGSTEIEKKLDEFKNHSNKETVKLAKEFSKFQEKSIEKLKKYL